jgi:hypothetical protein
VTTTDLQFRGRLSFRRRPMTDWFSSLTADFDLVGLCRTCRQARLVTNPRGSVFYRCQLAESDPRFARYPRLPVVRCSGYERSAPESEQT